ncbi:hypothetical protein ABFS82_03G068200 [Erythranthe guttata]|uniref:pentatricopeptide repeat-containing protein At1g19720 n=1 Tax=Erythranthe guttata TaxID=4155 RepID=UPI00064DDF13|nr:PREDICTED: pentatricopeptide repeat-containing protein At1g19720 [Erythranthe guttata]|eukprot:XP_012835741.1 PREDICTED: pentatricopeptide repeat-containing protein At1g19720 [Erythranthe guttata]
MEIAILPCKTIIIPSKISEYPSKFKAFSRIAQQKLANDAYLKGLCNHGRLTEAISSLDSCGSTVSPATLSSLIESCIDSNSLDLCYKLHATVKKWVKEPDPFLETKLVGMYAKCGSLDDAFIVFEEMRQRNLYTWSAIIGACSREKRWGDVVELFYWMMKDGDVIPDNFLFPKILQACSNSRDAETGRLIHGMAIKLGLSRELRVNNSILSVYAKCGLLSLAEKFFERMEVNDRVSWNAMITGYCHAGQINEAERLIESMKEEGLEPDEITWNVLISSCNHLGKCDVAKKLMNAMETCGVKPDVFTWTSMILGFAQNNRRLEAVKLFREMLLSGVVPNGITVMSAISACSSLKDVRKGKEVHLVAIKLGHGEDVLVGNSLVDMYSKCGKLDSARRVFDTMSEKDVYTWNSMIGGYCQAGYCGVAHDLFKQMQESGFILPNVVTWNVMITGYIQNGDEDEAMDMFNTMEKIGGVKRDTATWNALIAGLLDHGQKNKALGIFRQMQSCGVKPNSVTVLSILPACANLIAVKKLKEIHCCVVKRSLESELSVANSMIDTYAKAGEIEYSKKIFANMPSVDIITWNTMTTGYVLHGCADEAIELFEHMTRQECRPNRGTFASVISAYGLAKKVEEGKRVFSNMTEEYQIVPCLDHYVAVVNLYGRSGKVDEAFEFVANMASEESEDVSIWRALLTCCRRHGNVKLAIHAGEKLLELEPDNNNDTLFVRKLVLQLYDLRGISKESLKMKRKETTGYSLGRSWIEEKNTVHTFVSGDLRQLDGKSLRSWIERVESCNKESQYRDMLSIEEEEEEEEEESVGIHSEKLALAFALIKSCRESTPRTIRVVKNVRMCGNCHRFAKLVSKRHGCEIYISDSKSLHHFKNGVCSCRDYW